MTNAKTVTRDPGIPFLKSWVKDVDKVPVVANLSCNIAQYVFKTHPAATFHSLKP